MKSATRIWMPLLGLLILATFPIRASAQENESYTLRCSSDDMRRHECNIPYDEVMDVDVGRQISGSPCIEGESWGYEGNILWVDRGCRAEFEVQVWRGGASTLWRCKSDNERLNRCTVPGGVWRARLERQNSGSPCIEGQSWGFDSSGIWVDRGCRADFRVWSGGQPSGNSRVVRCRSNNERLNRCEVKGHVIAAQLEQQYSGSPCIQYQSWGFDKHGLWTDHGCRADFRVWTLH